MATTSRVQKRPVARLELFSHLLVNTELSLNDINSKLHPSVLQVGLWINRGIVTMPNTRCEVMLQAFKEMMSSYEGSDDKDLRRDLEAKLRPHISFLTKCRPMSVSMKNAIKFIRLTISNLDPLLAREDAKKQVMDAIDNFIHTRIKLAVEEISKHVGERIHNGDVIVIYAGSQAVETALVDAHCAGTKFSVIVLDSNPLHLGRALTKRLSKHGIACSYSLIGGAEYVMKDATKVFLGAHTFFANGHMMAPAGSSIVAMVAKRRGIPVMVCCETYKFCAERVQTDSFVFNELDNPDKRVVNLVFDVTPPDFIDMIVTEIGCVPCTSIPVIIREHGVGTTLF